MTRDLDEIVGTALVVDARQVVITAQRCDDVAETHTRRVAGTLRRRRGAQPELQPVAARRLRDRCHRHQVHRVDPRDLAQVDDPRAGAGVDTRRGQPRAGSQRTVHQAVKLPPGSDDAGQVADQLIAMTVADSSRPARVR